MVLSSSVRSLHKNGFTIVELLIVVVVIAILAAITIIAYNGIQNRAYDTAIKSDLKNLGTKALSYVATESRTLPIGDDNEMAKLGLSVSASAYGTPYVAGSNSYNLLYCWDTSPSSLNNIGFIAGSKSGKTFVFKDGTVTEAAGPLGSYVGTCTSNGLPSNAAWFYNAGTWRWVTT